MFNFKSEQNMAYIYCITNLINKKKYVGKTTYSITKRFQEHCRDSKKERCNKRPLYDAMNKYGIENFIVEQLIECDELELNSYECLFIEQLNTYNNGYNATKGGDGSILFDYKEIVRLYQEGLDIKEVASKIQCCKDTVSNVLHLYNVKIRNTSQDCYNENYEGCLNKPVKIARLDKNTEEVLETYNSMANAAHWLVDNGFAKTYNGGVRQKISMCCKGEIKSAYKHKWKIIE